MKSGICTFSQSYGGGNQICFHAKISGRDVGVIVNGELLKLIAAALKHTNSVGHALWHAQNPESALPCGSCN